jgi:hypothetical protein
VAGASVPIEAMGGQKALAKTSTEQGAEYVLALQDNPPTRQGWEMDTFFTLEALGVC